MIIVAFSIVLIAFLQSRFLIKTKIDWQSCLAPGRKDDCYPQICWLE
jgi:hypothetical protein